MKNRSKDVIIIGAGGHGKVIADIVQLNGDDLLGFLDDAPHIAGDTSRIKILGGVADYIKYPCAHFIIAIGNAQIRKTIADRLGNVNYYTAIHPRAVISNLDVTIGAGSAVMANAVISPSAHIGNHCIINTSAVVEHDNTIEDFTHISVGAKLGGTVKIGPSTWIGIGATVSNNLTICSDCMIGAGAVVINNIEESGTYVGIPAKKIK